METLIEKSEQIDKETYDYLIALVKKNTKEQQKQKDNWDLIAKLFGGTKEDE